jgi:abortive infection bacteriophage resistance protein
MSNELRPLKTYKSFREQLDLLRARGLSVSDEQAALAALQRLGYYRLSGYFYPLRKTNPAGEPGRLDEFVDGASFELVVQLAEFDKKLRMLVLDAIEVVEVALRVAMAYRLGKLHPEAHLRAECLDGRFTKGRSGEAESQHTQWLKRFDAAREKSRDEFVDHHRAKYNCRMPIWVAIEVWDFGMLSRLFAGLQSRDRNALAHAYGLGNGDVLRSWLRTFNFLRNVAAHHSRLWNRTFPEIPRLPAPERCRHLDFLRADPRALEKLFGALSCLRFLMQQIAPDSTWHRNLGAHVATFPVTPLVSVKSAGFPEGWSELPLWM